jgi:hypothetical protein
MSLLILSSILWMILVTIYFNIQIILSVGVGAAFMPWPSTDTMVIFFIMFVGWFVLILLFTRMFGPAFYSAFFSPFRWCAYRLGAIRGIFREIATYIVRSRGWSVVLAIAMGLEGYRHQLPRV